MAGEGEAGDRGGRDNILAFENVKRLGSVKTVMLTVMILQTFNSSPRPFSFKRRGAFLPSLFKLIFTHIFFVLGSRMGGGEEWKWMRCRFPAMMEAGLTASIKSPQGVPRQHRQQAGAEGHFKDF